MEKNTANNPVAKLRELFYEKRRNRVPSKRLRDLFKKQVEEKPADFHDKKIARKPDREVDV